MKALHKAVPIGAALAFYSTSASAQLSNQGMLDQVVTEFATRASAWQAVVTDAASWLFWTLVVISMVWTFGMMALRKADIGEFFAELVRFTIFTGFFWWLLINGPAFANSIIQGLSRIGEQASGVSAVTPSGIVDVGFMIFKQALRNSSVWSPVDSLIGLLLSVGILVLLATIAVNMLLLLVSAWLLAYAGIFFLGFGGSRWTSDMAINYYKTVLGVAAQIMTMVLLIGIGNDLLSSFYAKMNKSTLNFEELAVMLVFCVALLMLVNRVPPLVAGVITGSGVGGAGGIGNFGAGAVVGAAVGAAAMAAGGAAMAGKALMGAASGAAGGASALKAAFEKAQAAMADGGGGGMPSFGGGGGDSGGGGGDAGTSTPLSEAAGYGGGSSGGGFGGGAMKAARLAAGTVGNLAKGASSMAAEKFNEKVSQTAGGKLAASIRESTQSPSFGGNSLSGGEQPPNNSDEVSSFVNRDRDREV